MKKVFGKLLIYVILFLNLFSIKAWCINLSNYEYDVLYNGLTDIGLDNNSINSIITYIYKLPLSKEEGRDIRISAEELYESVSEKQSLSDFGVNEMISLYKKASSIADKLNLGVSYSIGDGEIIIKDKENGNSLIKASPSQAEEYIEQIKSYEENKNIGDLSKLVKGELKQPDTILAKEDNVAEQKLSEIDNPVVENRHNESNLVNENIDNEEKVEEPIANNENKVDEKEIHNDLEVKPDIYTDLCIANENRRIILMCIIAIGCSGIVTLLIKLTTKTFKVYLHN